jgi:RNA polymerase sigma-70 factor (ECF subfamily)
MIAARAGDKVAYRTLLRESSSHLRAYFRRRLPGRTADAEDLVQETLIALHTKAGTYDPQQPFTPWLHAIARYRLIDSLRRSGRRPDVPLDEATDVVAGTDPDAAIAGRDLEQLLAKLPSRTRELVKSVKLEGLSTREAAARTGMSETAVKVAVHRALRTLSTVLTGRRP